MTRRFFLATLLVTASATSFAADVAVAVAANFAAPMKQIAEAFEKSTGHRARVAVGSTGRFYAQIRNGAPYHLLLAADEETPARLEREGLGVAGSRFTYAIGRLVLWSARPGVVDDGGQVLRQGSFDRLAIADPKLAPYGAAAIAAMDKLGVLERLRPRLVQGESIGQAFQFVATGNAALGFVALSQLKAEGAAATGKGSSWLVPSQLHPPLRQQAIVLLPGRDNPAARELARFLRSDAARTIIRAHGYEL
ncbi:molybdate ABC transporter substrate-binding protein [Ramlibacter sp. AW1]|uniref:Molybdate ABC transporter substrate-binding protein n=1 Tax=Ramlibacter aurantiacus TaxID=2801330 RepID=A0A936ZYH8_9BURK|nr:molybdate ABC transporter substrate-binding protein [Ramlibacter aurantiacus]MBL0423390.1 molybdate ABC transporter substrate-binding protein [Ramlibacter aurantiacus]